MMDYISYVVLAFALVFTFGGSFILIQTVMKMKKAQEKFDSSNAAQPVDLFPRDWDLYRDRHQQKMDEETRYLHNPTDTNF